MRGRIGALALLLLVLPGPGWAAAASGRGAAPTELRVVYSRPLVLFYALESVLGVPSRSSALAQVLCASRGEDRVERAITAPDAGPAPEPEIGLDAPARCRRARTLGRRALDALPRSFRFWPQEPRSGAGWADGRNIEEVLEGLAVLARDFDGFMQSAAALMPTSALRDLRGAMEALDPLVAARIERRMTTTQRSAPRRMRELLSAQGALAFLRSVAPVMGSAWADDLPLQIGLVPVPIVRGSGVVSYGHRAGHVVVVEMLRDDDLNDRLGVVLHELVHVLWFARPPDVRARLDAAFHDLKQHEASLAQGLLNEALATALGNGLFRARVFGSLPSGSWYADPAIDGFARAILPLLQARLATGAPLDAVFADQVTRLLAARFPGADRDPRFAFRRVVLLSGSHHAEGRALARTVRRRLRASHLRRPGRLGDPGIRAAIAARPGYAVVMVVAPASLDELEPYLRVPPLREAVRRAGSEGGGPVVLTCRRKRAGKPGAPAAAGRWYAVIVARDAREADAGLARLGSASQLPDCDLLPPPAR